MECLFKLITCFSISYVLALTSGLSAASALNLEGELFKELMKGYNKNVRPTEKSGDITQVNIKMTLTNLISLVSEVHSGVFDESQWLQQHCLLNYHSLEWKGGSPDNQRLDRNGNLTPCFAMIVNFNIVVYLQDMVKPIVFLYVAMVWLQAQMGPTAQVSSVWEHHLWAEGPLQEHLAARHHSGEQVSATTFTFYTSASKPLTPSLSKFSHWNPLIATLCSPTSISIKAQKAKSKKLCFLFMALLFHTIKGDCEGMLPP